MIYQDGLPSGSDLYLKHSLYTPVDLSYLDGREQAEYVRSIEYPKATFDTYCVECKQISTFKPSEVSDRNALIQAAADYCADLPSRFKRDQEDEYRPREEERIALSTRFFPVSFDCARNDEHRAYFVFRFSQGTLTKIGQYPSIADMGLSQIRQYEKILGEEKSSELYKAIGLASHGIGIGAFVYLRRIFEYLIRRAHSTAQKNPTWDESQYEQAAHIDEKVQLLKDFLPPILIQNRKLYSILSKGIHELSEDECKAHFNLVRLGIELILDGELERRNRQKKVAQFEQQLDIVHKELKKA